MSIILWLVFGALAGWIASKIAGTDSQQGWVMNIVMGIVGALVGGFLWRILTGDSVSGFNLGSLLVSIVGALIVSFGLGKLTGKRTI